MIDLDTLCVELTLRCPLRCVHCSANAAPERTEMMDAALLLSRVKELGSVGAIYLSGGEPFEHARLPDLVESLAEFAGEVSIYSSGVTIGPVGNEPLSDSAIRMVSRRVSRIDLSIYSLSPAEHDDVTGVSGSFDLTVHSIRRLRLFGVPFGIHFVPVRADDSILQVAQFAREAGASRFHVLAIARQGRASAMRAGHSNSFVEGLQILMSAKLGMEVLVSSQLRRLLDMPETYRDSLRAAFMDVRGHVYRSEGARAPSGRSLRTIRDAGVAELLSDMA